MTRAELTRGFFGLIDAGMPLRKAVARLAAGIVDSKKTAQVDLVMADIAHELQVRGHAYVKVTSARELNTALSKEITELIRLKTGAKTVEIESEQDANLIGGAVIETTERTYDFSIRGKLNALKNGVNNGEDRYIGKRTLE